jgi:hypothetical protein
MYTEQANIDAPTLAPLTLTDIMSISRAICYCYISSATIIAALILSPPFELIARAGSDLPSIFLVSLIYCSFSDFSRNIPPIKTLLCIKNDPFMSQSDYSSHS